jgi:hypothetical protein
MCSVVVNFSFTLYLFDFSNVFLYSVQSLGDFFLNRTAIARRRRRRGKKTTTFKKDVPLSLIVVAL